MLPRPLSVRSRGFLGLAVSVLSLFFATALLAEAPRPEQTLTLGQETQEQKIKAGEAHSWRLTVPPGTSVLVTVNQRSVHLVLVDQGPGKMPPVIVEAGNSRWGPAILLLDRAGDHRIKVRSEETSAWPGRYTIRAEALPASPAEYDRRDAFALMSRAAQEATPDTPKSRQQAIATYQKALSAWQRLREPAWEAEALFCLALQEKRTSDLPKATRDFQAALDLWRQIKEQHREAETLNLLGLIYQLTEGMDKARAAHEKAVALWRRLGERADEEELVSNLCLLEKDPQTALICHQNSLEVFRKLQDQGNEARILHNIGDTYSRLGKPDDALASYEQALDLRRRLGDHQGEAQTLNNMATVHRALGEWQEALRLYGEVRKILPLLGDRVLEANLLNNIAYAYDNLGEPERAAPHYEAVLGLRRTTGDLSGEVTALNNLGSVLRKLGELQKALALHRRALEIATDRLGDPAQQAISRLRLAEDHLAQGNAATALRELDAAPSEKLGLKTQTDSLDLRGRALILAGRTQEALPVLQEVLARRRAVRDRAGEAETLDDLATAKRALGFTAEARADAEAALNRVEELRSDFASPDLRASFLATRHRAYALLVELRMDQDAAEPGQGHDREAFAISDRGRARSLLDALRVVPAASTAPDDLLKRRRSLLRQLSDKVDQRWKQNGDRAAALEREIDEIRSRVDDVEAEIRQRDPRLAARPASPPAASPEGISSELGPGTMLLEYSLGDDRSFLWAIDSRGLRSFVLPAQKEIETLVVAAYRELSRAGSGAARQDRSLAKLSRTLLSPIWKGWKGAAPLQRLVIVPDASLQLLPFAALPVPAPGQSWTTPGKPLLEYLEVAYLPSATTLAVQRQRLQNRPPAPKWAAVFADPVFASNRPRRARPSGGKAQASRGPGTRGLPLVLEPLPATRREAQAIRKLAPAGQVRLALGLAASRDAALSRDLRDYRVLHFATHAIADTQYPELSGLMLSQVDAAGRPREGFLGLTDIYELDLDADLVVLSGCQTALGKQLRGEGVMGLTRGFQYAGVPRVVASLWRVQDRATAELMTLFYQAMWRRHDPLSPAAALRAAQRSLRQNPGYRDSYSWAGFVLQGDWRENR